MKSIGTGGWVLALGLFSGAVWGQTTNTQGAPAAAPAASTAPVHHHHHHHHRVSQQSDQVIPRESQGVGAPASDETPGQKVADQKLLQQQEAQSAHAAAVTNQVVEQAQKQQQKIQHEVRIQDAPGPSQTGVVPAAGVPVAPVNSDDRIQDAPGPAQTIAPLPATTAPASTTQPAQTPATPPQE